MRQSYPAPALLALGLLLSVWLTACSQGGGGVINAQVESSSSVAPSSSSIPRVTLDYTVARQRNASLHRGVNLGNFLDAGGREGNWTGGRLIDSSWFPALKTSGFQSVRLPVRWSHHVDMNTGLIDPLFLQRVQTVVRQANAAGLVAIINQHHFDELTLKGFEPETSFVGTNPDGSFQYEVVFDTLSLVQASDLFRGIWTQVSSAMAGVSNDSLVFETLNEPTERVTPTVHNGLIADAVRIIRQQSPGRTIMVGLTNLGKWEAVDKLQLPADGNMILSVHFYEPVSFALQGEVYPSGKAWGTATEKEAVDLRYAEMAEMANVYFPSTDGKGIPINIGEFGVNASADATYRLAWINQVVKNCDRYAFSYHYWAFNSAGYQAAEPYTTNWLPGMLEALVPAP